MTKAVIATPNHPLYCLDDLIENRRNVLRYTRTFPPGAERNRHRQIAVNCRVATRLVQEQKLVGNEHKPRLTVMQKYFFDMKDGVPLRDRIGMEFKNNADAIAHCVVLAEHFYRDSLSDDQDLEISVVNALGREIHRELVHRR